MKVNGVARDYVQLLAAVRRGLEVEGRNGVKKKRRKFGRLRAGHGVEPGPGRGWVGMVESASRASLRRMTKYHGRQVE